LTDSSDYCRNFLCTRTDLHSRHPLFPPGSVPTYPVSAVAFKVAMDREAESVRAGLRRHGPAVRTESAGRTRRRLRIYLEPRDIWVGVYVGKSALYVCPLPCVVIRWQR
jgi:hypothetical protein